MLLARADAANSRGMTVFALSAGFLVVAVLAVFFRLTTRLFVVRNAGYDDALIVIAAVGATVIVIQPQAEALTIVPGVFHRLDGCGRTT